MYVLVTYDVSTTSAEGRRRLQRIAKTCLDYGQRVQNSVFELLLDYSQWTQCKHRLTALIDPQQDSLRFYYLGNNWRRRVEHVGTKPSQDFEGPLIV
jgi:CRISPR-associated protein Cas2